MSGGLFISLEGIDGTGKTTQAGLLAEYLRAAGLDVVLTHEPGGTPISEGIRGVLLSIDHSRMSPVTELLLYNAARVQHLEEKIIPSLDAGRIVITDRFTDSTIAYQGYGRGLDLSLIHDLDRIATKGMRPDITILLDLDVEAGLLRNRMVNKVDRLELEKREFHQRVREGFKALAAAEPERFFIVDAAEPVDAVTERIRTKICEILADSFPLLRG
ncbi:MAG: dTMP kinase [Nitrospirales bacterium]|nr:dTMP kinase [Nitrospirales bacterium]